MRKRLEDLPFLYRNGGYVVCYFILIGLLLNAPLAFIFFKEGKWILCVWSIFSIFLLPKATLGLVLIMGRNSFIEINMPLSFWNLFPRTMAKYRSAELISVFGNPVLKWFVLEIFWFLISFIPLAILIIQH